MEKEPYSDYSKVFTREELKAHFTSPLIIVLKRNEIDLSKGLIAYFSFDGNSNDFRYINIRRTVMFIEQSVKDATKAYVFSPNDARTWVAVKGMLDNFLTDLWKQGGLAGAKPADAFSARVGLGVTMTNDDISNGIMRMEVLVALSRPAEFIVITFKQEMQKA